MTSPNEDTGARPSRYVSCTDGMNRAKQVTLYATNDHVVLLTPPPEAAVLTPEQARELGHQLFALANEVDEAGRPRHAGSSAGLRPKS